MTELNSDRRDIFISYSSKDRMFAEKLAADLSELGLRVWIDTLEMKVGDSLGQKIQHGILGSGWLTIVLSPDAVGSTWVEKELNAALALELERRDVFVLPIFYRDCNIPLFLRDKVYADFRTDYQKGRADLLKRLKPPIDPTLLVLLMSGQATKILSAHATLRDEEREVYVAQLCRNLDSTSVSKRIAALTALFVTRERNILSHLMRMANDDSGSVRRYAVFYLGEIRARSAVNVISEKLSDNRQEVRAAARDAYRKITGRAG